MNNSLIRYDRFFKMLYSHGMGQLITVCTNIFLPSFLLLKYDSSVFGIWIVANSLSQFLIYSDLGLSSSLFNSTSTMVGEISNEYEVCHRILVRILRRIFLSTLIYFSVAAIVFHLSKLKNDYSLMQLFFTLSFSVCTTPLTVWVCAVQRLKGKQYLGVLISNYIRLFELFVLVGGVFFGATLWLMVLTIGILRCCLLFVLIRWSEKKLVKKPSLDLREINFLSSISSNSGANLMAMLTIPLATQTPVLLIGMFFGPVIAGLYNMMRTLARMPTQLNSILVDAVNQDISEKYKNRDLAGFVRINILFSVFATALIFLCCVVVVIFRKYIDEYWLHQKYSVDISLYLLLSLQTLIFILMQVLNSSMMSISQGVLTSRLFFISQILFAVILFFGSSFFQLVDVLKAALISDVLFLFGIIFVFFRFCSHMFYVRKQVV